MQNRESKRAAICGVSFIALSESTVTNVPGVPQIKVSGIWDKMKFSSAEFSEQLSSDGTNYEVNLTISFSDSSQENQREIMAWIGIYLLVRLDYTDGNSRVVGTDQFPVVLSLSGDGSPHALRLTYKGQQPESSKFL